MSNYVQAFIDEITTELPDNDSELNRLYALLAMTTGLSTTLEDVHEAWGIWTTRTRPEHPSLIPFEDLSYEIQEYDREYRDAIVRVAELLGPIKY